MASTNNRLYRKEYVKKQYLTWNWNPNTRAIEAVKGKYKKVKFKALIPSRPRVGLHITLETGIQKLIMYQAYIDKVTLIIDRDYIRESSLEIRCNPGGSPTLALHNKGRYLHISIMGEAFHQDDNIKDQVLLYLKRIYECYGMYPIVKLTSNKQEIQLNTMPSDESESDLFELWLKKLKMHTIEITFPLGPGHPTNYVNPIPFHNFKSTLYHSYKIRKKDRKDHLKLYDMVPRNKKQLKSQYDSFTKLEFVFMHTWVKLSLASIEGNVLSIVDQFKEEIKGELSEVGGSFTEGQHQLLYSLYRESKKRKQKPKPKSCKLSEKEIKKRYFKKFITSELEKDNQSPTQLLELWNKKSSLKKWEKKTIDQIKKAIYRG